MKRYVCLVISLLIVSGCVDPFPARNLRRIRADTIPFEVQEGLRKLDLRMKVEEVVFVPGWGNHPTYYSFSLTSADGYRFSLDLSADGKPLSMMPLGRIEGPDKR
jgi:hypothetical protein